MVGVGVGVGEVTDDEEGGGEAVFLKVIVQRSSSPAKMAGSCQRTKTRMGEERSEGGIVSVRVFELVYNRGCWKRLIDRKRYQE